MAVTTGGITVAPDVGDVRPTWRRHTAVRSGDQLAFGERSADRIVKEIHDLTCEIHAHTVPAPPTTGAS